MQKIPTISFNDLKDRNSDVLEFLTRTLENNGFFIINDHSIDTNLIEKVFSVAEDIFKLPYETKYKYHIKGSNGARGSVSNRSTTASLVSLNLLSFSVT